VTPSLDFALAHSNRDFVRVAELASEIWTEHFTPIIGPAQVEYMLERFQSAEAIAKQVAEEGYEYQLVYEAGELVGYFALVFDDQDRSAQLSKLYAEGSRRGRGLGRSMVERIEDSCRYRGMHNLWLTVNKRNASAIAFYRRLGFAVADAVVTDIGGGFVMDDFVMRKAVSSTPGPSPLDE